MIRYLKTPYLLFLMIMVPALLMKPEGLIKRPILIFVLLLPLVIYPLGRQLIRDVRAMFAKKTPISLRGEWLFLIGMLFFTNLAFQGLGMLEVLFYTKLFPEFMIKVFWNDGIEFDKANEIVLALVCAPLFEEIVFRGYLFGYLKRRYTIFIALFFSSLAFGFLHVAYPLSAVVFGMVACGLYMRYGTLSIPILFHFIANLIAVLAFRIWGEPFNGLNETLIHETLLWSVFLCVLSIPFFIWAHMKRGLFKGLFFPRFSLNDLISGIRSFPKLKLIVGILLFIVLDGAYIYVNYTIAGGEDSVIAGKLKEKPNKNEFPMTSDYIVAGAFVSGKEDVGGYYLFSFNCGKPYGQNDFSCNISALQFSESPKGVCEVSLVQTARRRAVREGDGLKIPFQSVYGALEIYLSKEESKLVRSKINDDSRGLFGNEKLETPLEISFLVESARDRTEPAYNESFPEIHKKMQGLLPVCGMGSTSYSI